MMHQVRGFEVGKQRKPGVLRACRGVSHDLNFGLQVCPMRHTCVIAILDSTDNMMDAQNTLLMQQEEGRERRTMSAV